MAMSRDLDEGFFPQPWPDQWAAYSLGEMAEWGLADHHVTYARRLLERFAMIVRFAAPRGTSYGSIDRTSVVSGKSMTVRSELGARLIIEKKLRKKTHTQ